MATLVRAASRIVRDQDDVSLVGLAAWAGDAVVMAAFRESVVLYAEVIVRGFGEPRPRYEWRVDDELARRATRVIDTFNRLYGERLPFARPAAAERYWRAARLGDIAGRCVRLGSDDGAVPVRHYHWAVCHGVDGVLRVHEFWKPEVWTTERYRSVSRHGAWCPEL